MYYMMCDAVITMNYCPNALLKSKLHNLIVTHRNEYKLTIKIITTTNKTKTITAVMKYGFDI